MFKEFHPQGDHSLLVEACLESAGSEDWQVLPRKNSASSLPSDFALLKVCVTILLLLLETSSSSVSTNAAQVATEREAHEPLLLEELRSCSNVKYVVEQRQYHDPLSSFVMQGDDDSLHMHNTLGLLFDMEQVKRNSSVCKDHESLEGATAVGRNSAEIPGFDFGDTFGTGRRLLSTGYQVTHELNAEFLWDKAHTGSGVKVAVFDTGLGANHPHFRNVKVRR